VQVAIELRALGHADLKLRPGDHICAFYFGVEQRDALLHPYIREGLAAGERCMCLLPPEEASDLFAGRSSKTVVRPASPATAPTAISRLVGFVAENEGVVAAHRGDGRPLRIASDLTWVMDQQPDTAALVRHERWLGGYVRQSGQVALCLCDLDKIEARTVMDLLISHPKVLLGRHLATGALYLGDAPVEAGTEARGSGKPGVLEGVLALSTLMTMTHDPGRIVALAGSAVSSLGAYRLDGVFITGSGWHATQGPCRLRNVRAVVEARLSAVDAAGGSLPVPGEPWSWVFPLWGVNGNLGCLIVGGDAPTSAEQQFLLQLVAFQTGSALANARLHRQQRSFTDDLRRARAALADMAALADWRSTTHARLREVVATRAGVAGIADALHEMTGHTVVVEDADGAARAWAGFDDDGQDGAQAPVAAATPSEPRRSMLERARRTGHPIWDGTRLVAAAHRDGLVVGSLAFVDPAGEVTEGEVLALEDGAALLALELDHQQELAETETRLGRDLVDDLLAGSTEQAVAGRAQALGFDLERRYRVVLVTPRQEGDRDAFFRAVQRAARDTGVGSFLARRDGGVAVLSATAGPWEPVHAAVVAEPGGGPCRIGVGEATAAVDLPGSLRQARLVLKLQDAFGEIDDVVAFEQLGIFRLLVETAETSGVERFVKDWLSPLAPLLDYDAENRSELVSTLSHYLESGRRYDATAQALNVHRSTLKYRLQRIKDVSGHDLGDPDTLFTLHLATRAWRTLVGLRL
jgi:sugar diacid utilization regulator